MFNEGENKAADAAYDAVYDKTRGEWVDVPRKIGKSPILAEPFHGPGIDMKPAMDAVIDLMKTKPYRSPMRQFETGATRNSDAGRPDYDGYLSPSVLEEFGRYMLRHSTLEDGTHRASDNWQKGIPLTAYMKSSWRHFIDLWREHRAPTQNDDVIREALCALLFNVAGYLHEYLKSRKG